MPNWFYFDKDTKKGPFTSEELFSLAASGEIRWGTIVETEDGRQTSAKNVKGLFPTQELATQPFVPVPPGAIPPVAPGEGRGIPPVAESPSPSDFSSSEEARLDLSVSASHEKTSFMLLPFLLFGSCVLCFLFSVVGIYFACEAVHERKMVEGTVERYLHANIGEGLSDDTALDTFFADNRLRSLQCTIHSSVAFLLAGMLGMTAIFLFVGQKLLRQEFTK